jgi:hypothetical protein
MSTLLLTLLLGEHRPPVKWTSAKMVRSVKIEALRPSCGDSQTFAAKDFLDLLSLLDSGGFSAFDLTGLEQGSAYEPGQRIP